MEFNGKAVIVQNGCKSFGRRNNATHVLRNIYVNINRGTIYGLLGASGCGKTTLVSCIVGRKELDSGNLWVLGGFPKSKESGVPGKKIGYMPQHLALYAEFSIRETFMFYGWIFNMKTFEIDDRLKFYANIFNLSSHDQLIKNLSGGQKRRVSLAIAVMHSPELTVLDEPTVGVDPILSEAIWKHLLKLSQDDNMTIILTTHYIEEARQADNVGIMRNGRLLAEDSPHDILNKYNLLTLEDVFLQLAIEDGIIMDPSETGENEGAVKLPTFVEYKNKKQETLMDTIFRWIQNILILTMNIFSMDGIHSFTTKGKMKALLLKNFLRIWRNIGAMLFIFGLPVIQVILFCLAIGRDPIGLKIAVVNHEVPNWGNGGSCNETARETCDNFACAFLKRLNKDRILQVAYPTVDKAIKAVKLGNAWGAMYFTDNFTDGSMDRADSGGRTREDSIDQSFIKTWLDASNQQISLMLNHDLLSTFNKFDQDMEFICFKKNVTTSVLLPIRVNQPIYKNIRPTFADFMAPGIILTISFFLAISLTTSTLISEHSEGLYERSWIAGVTAGEMLASHIITQTIAMCGQTALVLIFMVNVFGTSCEGNIFWIILLTLLQGFCGMFFGFAISAVCEKERTAIIVALGSFYPTILLSGIIWPLESIPYPFLLFVSNLLPLTKPTSSLRSIMLRGWAITDPGVYMGFLATITWIWVFLVFTVLSLKIKKR